MDIWPATIPGGQVGQHSSEDAMRGPVTSRPGIPSPVCRTLMTLCTGMLHQNIKRERKSQQIMEWKDLFMNKNKQKSQ